jgi:hypothetical protein
LILVYDAAVGGELANLSLRPLRFVFAFPLAFRRCSLLLFGRDGKEAVESALLPSIEVLGQLGSAVADTFLTAVVR